MHDIRTLKGIQNKDELIFCKFYDKTRNKIFSIAYKIVKNADLAEEIVNDVFLRVWQKSKTFSGDPDKFQAWINILTRNISLNILRTQDKEIETDLDLEKIEISLAISKISLDPARILDNKIIRNDIIKALQKAEPRNREAWILVNIKGYNWEETAEIMNCKRGTINWHITRANTILRKELAEYFEK